LQQRGNRGRGRGLVGAGAEPGAAPPASSGAWHWRVTAPTHAPPRSRPTAVNLADSAAKLKAVARKAAAADGATPEAVAEEVVKAAEATLAEDVAANKVRATTGNGSERVRRPLKGGLRGSARRGRQQPG
jgi:hypothetical protein